MSKKANNIDKLIVELLLEALLLVRTSIWTGTVFEYGGEIICCINNQKEIMLLSNIYEMLLRKLENEKKDKRPIASISSFMSYSVKIVTKKDLRKYLRPYAPPLSLHENFYEL